MMLLPASVFSQTTAVSFRQLEGRQLLKEGDSVTITHAVERGKEDVVSGPFVRLTSFAITIRGPGSGAELELAEKDVHRIVRVREDTVWKGAFIGGGVGLGYGAVTAALICGSAWECGPGEVTGYVLVMSSIGLGVGALIDAAHGGPQQEVIYLEPRQAGDSVAVRVAPILTTERKGVGITVSW